MKDGWIVGGWRVDFQRGCLIRRWSLRPGRRHPDARLMLVLAEFVRRPGKLVTPEELLARAWAGRVVSRDSVTTAIYQLRQLLGDSAENSRYIRSEPRRGYRLIAPVRPLPEQRNSAAMAAIAASLTLAGVVVWLTSNGEPPSIYVEPLANFAESPVQAPLFTAIETVFLSEVIRTVPGRVRTDDHDDIALRLQSTMVQCDLGPALVVRMMDTRDETWIWSKAYSLEEYAAATGGPTLVEQMARDVGLAVAAL